MKYKKVTKRHILVLFSVMSVLCSVMACSEDDEGGIVSVNDFETKVIVHQMNDSEDLSLSKKVRYKRKRGVVYLLNLDTDELIPYETMKISTMDESIMQEWLLSDLNEDYFDGQKMVPNKDDAAKTDYFYMWKGEICNMSQGTWEDFVRTKNNKAVKGFHVLNVIDLQKIKKIAGDFSDICDTLQIKPYGYYSEPRTTPWNSDKACLWLYPVSSTTKYYGMVANPKSGCGVFAQITPGKDSFVEVVTNIKDLYARVRLVRDIPKGQW